MQKIKLGNVKDISWGNMRNNTEIPENSTAGL
jgi:hypothetical protein